MKSSRFWVLSLVLLSILIAQVLPFFSGGQSAMAAAHHVALKTQSSIHEDEWCQCTDYVANYYGLPHTYPNAQDWPAWLDGLGWASSDTPYPGTIMVSQPYAAQAGGLGHVAVVQSVFNADDGNGWIITFHNSNWSDDTVLPFDEASCTNVKEVTLTVSSTDNVAFYTKVDVVTAPASQGDPSAPISSSDNSAPTSSDNGSASVGPNDGSGYANPGISSGPIKRSIVPGSSSGSTSASPGSGSVSTASNSGSASATAPDPNAIPTPTDTGSGSRTINDGPPPSTKSSSDSPPPDSWWIQHLLVGYEAHLSD